MNSLVKAFRQVTYPLDEVGYAIRCALGSAANMFNRLTYSRSGDVSSFSWEKNAENFEKKYGITGISHNYKFPEDMSAREVMLEQRYTSDGQGVEWKKGMVDEIVNLNPELSSLDFDRDNSESLVDIIYGTTSGYNPDDIAYYLQMCALGSFSKRHVCSMIEWFAECKMLDADISWMPAPETMGSIKEQLGFMRDCEPSYQELKTAYENFVDIEPRRVGRFSFDALFPELQNEENLVVA